ncbi:MAG: hypothetical protein ABI414_00690 [Devosia sp.]
MNTAKTRTRKRAVLFTVLWIVTMIVLLAWGSYAALTHLLASVG